MASYAHPSGLRSAYAGVLSSESSIYIFFFFYLEKWGIHFCLVNGFGQVKHSLENARHSRKLKYKLI